jgi:hypothetical protein
MREWLRRSRITCSRHVVSSPFKRPRAGFQVGATRPSFRHYRGSQPSRSHKPRRSRNPDGHCIATTRRDAQDMRCKLWFGNNLGDMIRRAVRTRPRRRARTDRERIDTSSLVLADGESSGGVPPRSGLTPCPAGTAAMIRSTLPAGRAGLPRVRRVGLARRCRRYRSGGSEASRPRRPAGWHSVKTLAPDSSETQRITSSWPGDWGQTSGRADRGPAST